MAIKEGRTGNPPPPRPRRHHYLENVQTKTFTPLEYQVELLDTAKNQNSIVFLGSGKTFLIVMLVKELVYQIRVPLKEGGKRIIILVPTESLAASHKMMIEEYTDLKAGSYGNVQSVQLMTNVDWENELQEKHVLVMTADVFNYITPHTSVQLDIVNLLIFDECHLAMQNAAYKNTVKYIEHYLENGHMRILGLAAPLSNKKLKPSLLEMEIQNLERTFKSATNTASDLTAISKYGTHPKEMVIEYRPYIESSETFLTIFRLLDEALEFLSCVKLEQLTSDEKEREYFQQSQRYPVELCYILMSLGPWCAKQVGDQFMKEIGRNIDTIGSKVSWSRMALLVVHTVLQQVTCLCDMLVKEDEFTSSRSESHPSKLQHLLDILLQYKPEEKPESRKTELKTEDTNVETTNAKLEEESGTTTEAVEGKEVEQAEENVKDKTSDSKSVEKSLVKTDSTEDPNSLCGIIFVRQRITAYILNMWLTEIANSQEDFKFVIPNFIVGRSGSGNSRSLKEATIGLHKQEEVLQKFRARECNLLIATAVMEEAIEVPKCNLVIRFDPPENFKAYIQSKGKAKASDSNYYIMVPKEESSKFLEDLHDYRTTEEILLLRSHKNDTTIDEVVDSSYADSLKPAYVPVQKEDGAKVIMSTAIALVNRYCAKLPSDTFTRLTPNWNITLIKKEGSDEDQYQCSLHLPINSPLKQCIVGDPMPSPLLSKQAVALKTCQQLHVMGELDDNLMPQGKEAVKYEADPKFLEEEILPGAARPGTTKRRQYYYKKVAEALIGALPGQSSNYCHLYTFSMKLTCPIPEEQNTRGRKIHDPADTPRGFGLLTTQVIPPICSFPVFTRSGEVTVSLEHISSDVSINQEQEDKLSFYHRYTFGDVLRLEKYPMSFNPEVAECSFFVIPTNKGEDKSLVIDWEFVDLIYQQKGFAPRRIPEEERRHFEFKVEKYLDAVVMPWYRNLDKPQFFYVAEICGSLNPKSDFPDAGFETFDGYYKEKYEINVMNPTQPLLDVDHTSARLNLLTPRYVNRKGVTLPTSSEQTKKAKRENLQQKQILVPELCIIHPFPASFWRKAVCLPCILYRVNSLLLAEHLRLLVAKEIGVGIPQLPGNFKWPTLDFGWTLADVLQKAQEAMKEEDKLQSDLNVLDLNKINSAASVPPAPLPEPNRFKMETWSNDMAKKTSDGELIIDTFDPSKVKIPDDDMLADEEISQINMIGSSQPINFDWKPIPKPSGAESPEVPRIRYGSPSNFEEEGWDSEWDMDYEDSAFIPLNLPGLGYISAPGVFNMAGLSLDLASCRDDDIWDSFDEESIPDESEFGKSPDPGQGVTEPLEEGAEGRSEDKQTENNSNWLSNCSQPEPVQEPKSEEEVEVVIEPQVIEKVNKIREQCIKRLDIVQQEEDGFNELYQNSPYSFPRISQALKHIAEYDDELHIRTSEYPPPESNETEMGEGISCSASAETSLAFGELLPDRDKVNLGEKHTYRIKFDEEPDLSTHSGPSPSIILQAFTMSNANDGINLERLETVGDSFLKYAITAYLFCSYPDIHEGKLSYLRSKQISNLNLYRLGKYKNLGRFMVATKFEPNDNWLPPGFVVPKGLEQALIESGLPAGHWNIGALDDLTQMNEDQIRQSVMEKKSSTKDIAAIVEQSGATAPYIPYNLLTQHSIPDKSIADCVEALIGAYLISCGPRGTLLFMSWLGLKVLPNQPNEKENSNRQFSWLESPPSPLLNIVPNVEEKLNQLLSGYAEFEQKIGYTFRDKSYLLQAFTHASYYYNRLTDCYQRLEFLGDAVLDYLITRHLYEDRQKHSPGTLTDLRSALVNNTFFASLAVKYDFHKYFKNISPGLFNVIQKFVEMKKKSTGFPDYEEYYLEEEECEEAEEVEVPKALGDIFESVAGAIYLDSNMSLDVVWRVYYAMMKPEIEYFSVHVPKSPIRELLELEPQTAKFERAEMTLNGKVRIRVEVFGKGRFVGIGRNKRIAKCTAAKRALRALKKMKREKEGFTA